MYSFAKTPLFLGALAVLSTATSTPLLNAHKLKANTLRAALQRGSTVTSIPRLRNTALRRVLVPNVLAMQQPREPVISRSFHTSKLPFPAASSNSSYSTHAKTSKSLISFAALAAGTAAVSVFGDEDNSVALCENNTNTKTFSATNWTYITVDKKLDTKLTWVIMANRYGRCGDKDGAKNITDSEAVYLLTRLIANSVVDSLDEVRSLETDKSLNHLVFKFDRMVKKNPTGPVDFVLGGKKLAGLWDNWISGPARGDETERYNFRLMKRNSALEFLNPDSNREVDGETVDKVSKKKFIDFISTANVKFVSNDGEILAKYGGRSQSRKDSDAKVLGEIVELLWKTLHGDKTEVSFTEMREKLNF